jgi:hypothetical protein
LISEPALLRFSDAGSMWKRQIETLLVDGELLPDQVRTLPGDRLIEMWLIEDFTILDGRATHEMPDLAYAPYGRAASKMLAQRFEQAWNEAEPVAEACRRLLDTH